MSNLAGPGALQLREASAAELASWDNTVRQFPNHRLVHTLAWVRSLELSGFGRPHFMVVEKDHALVGCLPGLLNEVGPLRLFGSPPPASQTPSMGPAFDPTRVTSRELMELIVPYVEHRLGADHMEIVSCDLDPAVMEGFGFRGEVRPTYRVRLYPGDECRTLQGLKDGVRRTIDRGIRQGLEVRFESNRRFVEEHYRQIRELHLRRGRAVNFPRKRVLDCFTQCHKAGNLVTVSVYLPNRVNIATAMFMLEGSELLLWSWARRSKYRWHRPVELMTWSVIQRALSAGCQTLDLTGTDDFKARFGTELDGRKYRWMRSRYWWLGGMRQLAAKGFFWQQAVRGRAAQWSSPTLGLEPFPSLRSVLRR